MIPQMLFITSLYEDSYARWYARVCIYGTKKSKFNILEKVYHDRNKVLFSLLFSKYW